MNNSKKNLTYEEYYGVERATEIKQKISKALTGRVSPRKGATLDEKTRKLISSKKIGYVSHRKGMTYEQEYGEEKANEIRSKQSKAREGRNYDDLYGDQAESMRTFQREKAVRLWKDPEYRRKVLSRREPSGPEVYFQINYIDKYNLPLIYMGNIENKQINIGGKTPDFMHLTEPILVEIFGDCFHKGQNPQNRIDYFKQFGYDCVVIWASELKNESIVFERLRRELPLV